MGEQSETLPRTPDQQLDQAFGFLIKTNRARSKAEIQSRGWDVFETKNYFEYRNFWPGQRDTYEFGAAFYYQLTDLRFKDNFFLENYKELSKAINQTILPLLEKDDAEYVMRGIEIARGIKIQDPQKGLILTEFPVPQQQVLDLGEITAPEDYLPRLRAVYGEEMEALDRKVERGAIDQQEAKKQQFYLTNRVRSHARGFGLAALENGRLTVAVECLDFANGLGESDLYQIANRVSTKLGEFEESENPRDQEEYRRARELIMRNSGLVSVLDSTQESELDQEEETYSVWLDNERKKLAEKELSDNYLIRGSLIEGRGLFSRRTFKPGEVISIYPIGKYEDIRPFEEVDPESDFAHNCIQVGINEQGKGIYLSVPRENPRNFVNHSCEPNTGLRITLNEDGEGKSELVAISPIKEGDEITIDYSATQQEEWSMECHCGKPACRHEVTEFGRLPKDLQEKYINLGIVQDYIKESIQKQNQQPPISSPPN